MKGLEFFCCVSFAMQNARDSFAQEVRYVLDLLDAEDFGK
jgi:hypothetical protein